MGITMNSSDIINIEDTETGLQMLDKLSRIKDGRRVEPLDSLDNIVYPHRYLYDEYNLQIGDTYFMIPPEFIMVNSEATSQSLVTLRQENTQRLKAGYHKRTIMIDLVFNGLEQLNGYKVEGPEGYYYVDGLRQLLAQFKCTPFLPITNELVNGMYGIFTVALQAITMSTMPGYPDVMTAQITLQEVNMYPYIEMPDVCFKYMIDWDLFRYYYQRMLTENHTYKKLQSLPANKEHNRFKISVLDSSVFDSQEATRENFLDLICDKSIVKVDESGAKDTTNYTTWVDSDTSDVAISSFQCGYSNLLTNIQLSDISSPTVQFIGGMDTIYTITFETTDYTVVQSLEQCQISNDMMTRNNIKLRSVGFVKLESELVAFTGSLFVMVDTVTTNTVPGFPGLYNVQMTCVAYDIAQSEREELHGFRPFECNKADCINNDFEPDHVHEEQAIEQSMGGLLVKVKQDNYAEWKIRTTMEVYPDLHLPTYTEVNRFINKCIAFREKHGLGSLPYKEYPTNPVGMLHGSNPNNSISVSSSHGVAYAKDINRDSLEYNIYVDPDFYVFYPCSYLSFAQQAEANGESYYDYTPPTRSSFTKTVINTVTPNHGETNVDTSLIEQFISLAKSFIGHSYVWGAEGEISDAKGKCFDCSGFVTYLLKEIGVMPANKGRFVVSTMPGDDLFTEVPWGEMQRGDILCNSDLTHVVIYEGDNTVIHAANKAPYPQGGVKESNQYFKTGRCLRPKAFTTSSSSSSSINTGDISSQIWGMLKAYGLSDIAAAGILGNAQAESGVNPKNLQNSYENSLKKTDTTYTQGVDNGSYTNFVHDSAGYGLFQFTYWSLKQDLLNEAKSRNVSISDTKLQVDVMISQIKSSGVFDKLLKASTVKEASNIFMLQYERPADQSVAKQNERAGYSQSFYDKFKGTSGSSSGQQQNQYTLTQDEFESICRVVMAETKGETSNAEKAVAQVIYDRLTHPNKKFGGLSNILNSGDQFEALYTGELNSTVEQNVKDVFCSNKKYWSNYTAWYFLTPEDTNATFKDRDMNYDRLGEVDRHTFWGKESKGSTIKYTISGTGTGSASDNNYQYSKETYHEAKTASEIARFAEPVLAKTDAIIYDDSWSFWSKNDNSAAKENGKEYLNDGLNIFYTSFCNEYQYSGRARLVRAFPAYLFCILDDHAQWYDGRKLWTNFYMHRSLVDISVHETNDMPTATARITVTNSYHNLDRTQGGLNNYSILEDEGYNSFQRWFYKYTNLLLGFGPKLTDKLIKLQQVICDHAKLREGARIHLRMGYGSDPLSLAPMINGHVSAVSLGDQIDIVVTSDGHELIQHVVSAKDNDTNNGVFGLFGLMEDQESSNIIANIMCERQSWVNYLAGDTFEGSAYSIEHFGLFFNQKAMATIVIAAAGGVVGGLTIGMTWGGSIGAAVGSVVPVVGTAVGTVVGVVLGGLVGAGVGALVGVAFDSDVSFADLWNGYAEQYDICKNIYKSDYSREHYIYADFGDVDGEQNFVFNKYNMTPWDVFQISTQQVPEYIVKATPHQFDSRLYFGLPFWMEKFRYDYLGGVVYEECKASTQVHMLDCANIIDNQLTVTSKFSNTNVKVMYTRGNEPVSTKTIHSDDTIDFAYQKTAIIDTSVTQDAVGLDMLYEFLGYNLGEESARRIGISNLLYGWQQQYQGQILLMGCPGISAHDYLMIYDTFSELYGIAITREVIHSFNVNTGFTTSVTPGMVGFSTDQESGMIQTCQNLLMVLNCFSSYIETRRQLRNNYEQYMTIFANFEVLRNKFESAAQRSTAIRHSMITTNTITTGITLVWGYNTIGRATFAVARHIKSLGSVAKVADTFMDAYKMAKTGANAVKGIKGTLAAIKAGTIAVSGAPTLGVGSVIAFAVWIIVDLLIQDIFEWLENRNVCTLLPLWWNGYPFVSGVKNGINILLIRPTSTDEEEPNFD